MQSIIFKMLTIKCFLELTGFCKSPGPGNANIFNQFLEDTDNSQIQSKQPIALSEVKMKRSFIHATCYGFKVEWNNKYPSQSIQRGDERKEVGAQCCTFWVELVMAWMFLTNIHHPHQCYLLLHKSFYKFLTNIHRTQFKAALVEPFN